MCELDLNNLAGILSVSSATEYFHKMNPMRAYHFGQAGSPGRNHKILYFDGCWNKF